MSKLFRTALTILLTFPSLAMAFCEIYFWITPYNYRTRVRAASIYFRCRKYDRSFRHYKKILKENDFFSLGQNSNNIEQLIFLYEKNDQFSELKKFIQELTIKKETDYLIVCRFLAVLGDFDSCARLIEHGKNKFGFCLPFQDELKIFNIVNIAELNAEELIRQQVAPAEEFSHMEPNCFGDKGPHEVHSLPIPAEEVFRLKDVQIIGANNIIKKQSLIVFDKAGNPSEGFVAGSWIYLNGSTRSKNQVLVQYPFHKVQRVERAILVAGRCSSNYFHFLIEYLSRFHDISTLSIGSSEISLIVDSAMPRQHFEAIELIFGSQIPRIYFNNAHVLEVGELIIPSFHTYIPDQFEIPFWQCSAMSKRRLVSFRNQIFKKIGLNPPQLGKKRKIFLSRAIVGNRSILNQKKVEKVFQAKGYEIVFPEKLSFAEQILLFSSASHIAGPAGAAFANLIFCAPGAKVISLIGEHNKGYSLISALCEVFDLNFLNVTGPPGRMSYFYNSEGDYVHGPFFISEENLGVALDEVE